jgi:cyd operon protein YbgT
MRSANRGHSRSYGEDLLSTQTARSRDARRARDLFSVAIGADNAEAVLPTHQKGRNMWYFAWILGVGFAVLLAILNAMWGENDEARKRQEGAGS